MSNDTTTTRRIESEGVDVTESIQILYDIAHGSMDWGSGFLDNDEMETVIRFAILMGWRVPDLPGNSPAIQTVAAKFPDHYRIETIEHPERTASNGYRFDAFTTYRIKAVTA